MRIGLLTADYPPQHSDIADHVQHMARGLVQAGHQVHVVTSPHGSERDRVTERDGLTIHRPAIPRGRLLYPWMLSRWLFRFLARTPLDQLHVHGMQPLAATRSLPVPVTLTCHLSDCPDLSESTAAQRQKLAGLLRPVQQIIATSSELADAVSSLGYTGAVHHIPPGVDVDRFAPGPAAQRDWWGVAPDECAILLAQPLTEQDGACVFARAINRLRAPGWQVVFTSDGPARKSVEQILEAGNRDSRCVFLDSDPTGDMPEIYRSANIAVLPSARTAAGVTGRQALSSGLPLVGTRIPGHVSLIREFETGLLVEPDNATELAATLDRLIQDPGSRYAMGCQARELAVAEFRWDQITAQTIDVLTQSTPQPGRRAA